MPDSDLLVPSERKGAVTTDTSEQQTGTVTFCLKRDPVSWGQVGGLAPELGELAEGRMPVLLVHKKVALDCQVGKGRDSAIMQASGWIREIRSTNS